MILFVSGRTDVLSYYPKWFINRIKEGFIDTRNPFNNNLLSRIYFKDVDLILFCSKNPHPFIKYLDELDSLLNIPKVFHITLTPYKEDIEPVISNIKQIVIDDIKYLAKRYRKNNIFLRYDPILKNKKYNLSYHLKAFNKLINLIYDSITNVVISFMDLYKNTYKNNEKYLRLEDFSNKEIEILAKEFKKITSNFNIKIFTCGEKNELLEFGFNKGACLSFEYAKKLLDLYQRNYKLEKQTARKGENIACNCVKMCDIGSYNSCLSMCRYYYANFNEDEVKANYLMHNDDSSLLIGNLKKDDIIKIRKK